MNSFVSKRHSLCPLEQGFVERSPSPRLVFPLSRIKLIPVQPAFPVSILQY